MSKKRNDIVSGTTMQSLIRDFLNGNEKAKARLIKITNDYAKLTNSRMKSLKNAGYDMFAYDRADIALFGMNRRSFKTNWDENSINKNLDDFMTTAKETRLFLSSEQSTVSGAKAKADRFLDQMDFYGWINRDSLSESTQRELVHLMGDGGLRELISVTYESVEDVLSTITDDIESGATFDEISDKIDAILSGHLDYDDYFKTM